MPKSSMVPVGRVALPFSAYEADGLLLSYTGEFWSRRPDSHRQSPVYKTGASLLSYGGWSQRRVPPPHLVLTGNEDSLLSYAGLK